MLKILYFLVKIKRYLRILFSTVISYVILILNGVNLGKRIYFDGIIRIVNHPQMSSIKIGNNCKFNSSNKSNLIGINHPCIISTHLKGALITIDDNCGFSGTVIACFDKIEFGKNVRCGANTLITDSDWHLDDPRVSGPKPIKIEDNVWLGYNVVVLKGVTIGKNSIIGAGSVVVKNIPSNVIAAGNPCAVIKSLRIE